MELVKIAEYDDEKQRLTYPEAVKAAKARGAELLTVEEWIDSKIIPGHPLYSCCPTWLKKTKGGLLSRGLYYGFGRYVGGLPQAVLPLRGARETDKKETVKTMNFTAQLPNGLTKDMWIAKLPKGTIFCTRRVQICANCGENSTKHDFGIGGVCLNSTKATSGLYWQPLPSKYKTHEIKNMICRKGINFVTEGIDYLKVPKKYAICSGRGTKAICECGARILGHCKDGRCVRHSERGTKYTPLKCELLSVMDEEEWNSNMVMNIDAVRNSPDFDKGLPQRPLEDNKHSLISGEFTEYENLVLIPRSRHGRKIAEQVCVELEKEASREGFETWKQLDDWLINQYGARPKLWRYEFRR